MPKVSAMGIWLGIILTVAVIAVLSFKALARKSFVQGRTPEALSDLYKLVQDQVSVQVFNEVWTKVGEAFSIAPELIRPDDKLKTLNNIDSWDLGEGGDALSQWIDHKQLGSPPVLETVLDLAKWVDAAYKNQSQV